MKTLTDSINKDINQIIDQFVRSTEIYGNNVIITKNIYYSKNVYSDDRIYLKKGSIGYLIDTHAKGDPTTRIFGFVSNGEVYEISVLDIINGHIDVLSRIRENKINTLLGE